MCCLHILIYVIIYKMSYSARRALLLSWLEFYLLHSQRMDCFSSVISCQKNKNKTKQTKINNDDDDVKYTKSHSCILSNSNALRLWSF